MIHPKTTLLAFACTLVASPILADAAMVDYKTKMHDAGYEVELAQYNIVVGASIYGSSDGDYDTHFTVASVFNPNSTNSDAGYETVLAERGFLVGVALYGESDADYGAALTPAGFFEAAALGQSDAGYEAILENRGIATGAALFGQYDADYEPVLSPNQDCTNCF